MLAPCLLLVTTYDTISVQAHQQACSLTYLCVVAVAAAAAAAAACCRPDRYVPHIRCMNVNSDILIFVCVAAVACCRPDRYVPHIRRMNSKSDMLICVCAAAAACCRPDRYVPLFGGGAYDIANEREGDMPFDEQLRGLEEVVKAGKVRGSDSTAAVILGYDAANTSVVCVTVRRRGVTRRRMSAVTRPGRTRLALFIYQWQGRMGVGWGDMPFDEQLRGLEEVVKAGKVRGRDWRDGAM
jgi:hypothetical protein